MVPTSWNFSFKCFGWKRRVFFVPGLTWLYAAESCDFRQRGKQICTTTEWEQGRRKRRRRRVWRREPCLCGCFCLLMKQEQVGDEWAVRSNWSSSVDSSCSSDADQLWDRHLASVRQNPRWEPVSGGFRSLARWCWKLTGIFSHWQNASVWKQSWRFSSQGQASWNIRRWIE